MSDKKEFPIKKKERELLKQKLFKPMDTIHCKGIISIEEIPDERMFSGDLGIQISSTGKVWICINGFAFLRFNPISLDYIRGTGFGKETPTSHDKNEEDKP